MAWWLCLRLGARASPQSWREAGQEGWFPGPTPSDGSVEGADQEDHRYLFRRFFWFGGEFVHSKTRRFCFSWDDCWQSRIRVTWHIREIGSKNHLWFHMITKHPVSHDLAWSGEMILRPARTTNTLYCNRAIIRHIKKKNYKISTW